MKSIMELVKSYDLDMVMLIVIYGLCSLYPTIYSIVLLVPANIIIGYMLLCIVVATVATVFSDEYRKLMVDKRDTVTSHKNLHLWALKNMLYTVALFIIALISGWAGSIVLCCMYLLSQVIGHVVISRIQI